MEKEFDSRALLVGTYDFVTCQRSDGSFYGNGGAQCKIGTQAELPTKLSGKLSPKTQSLCDAQADRISAVIGKPVDVASKDIEAFYSEKDKAIERIKNGEISRKEVEDYILHQDEFDISKAEFVVIGQEPKTSVGADKQIDHLANSFAQKELEKQGYSADEAGTIRRAVGSSEEAERGDLYKHNSYVTLSSNAAQQIVKEGSPKLTEQNDIAEAYFGGRKMASIEMSTVGAVTRNDGNPKNGVIDPNTSQYAHLGISRRDAEKQYADRRAAVVKNALEDAAQNGRLQGAIAMPGAGKDYDRFRREVVDKMWNGKSGDESNVRETTIKAASTGGATTKAVRTTIVDLGNGKKLTAHDMTFVTQGFQSGAKVAEIRREALKADSSPYTPSSRYSGMSDAQLKRALAKARKTDNTSEIAAILGAMS